MTKDKIQAAIKFINDKFDQDYIETEEYYHIFKYHGDTIRAALQAAMVSKTEDTPTADQSAPKVPDGWQLVPKEPTQEMYDIGEKVLNAAFAKGHEACPEITYKAMLSAAPTYEGEK